MSDQEHYDYSETVQAGNYAYQLLNNPAYTMAFGAVLEKLQREFFETPAGHVKTLEEIRRKGNALVSVTKELEAMITVAKQELDKQGGEA